MNGGVGTEHTNSRAKFGATQRDHVLADMAGNELTMLGIGVRENVLDEVIAILITSNVDQRNSRTIKTAFADAVEVATEEFRTTNLETFLDNLGGELVHAVLGSIADDVVNGSASISWSAVFANVLNAPVSELTVSNNVDSSQDFLNAGALQRY